MAKGFTKEMREDSKRHALDWRSPHMVVEGERMYLIQRLEFGGEVKVDATGLYFFLKEMFTTDWQKEAKS